MKPEKFTEGNKLIANYMGYDQLFPWKDFKINKQIAWFIDQTDYVEDIEDGENWRRPLVYHKDFNELNNVLEKIQKEEIIDYVQINCKTGISIVGKSGFIIFEPFKNKNNILSIWKAVIEFIKHKKKYGKRI